jgi:hypothetical protein
MRVGAVTLRCDTEALLPKSLIPRAGEPKEGRHHKGERSTRSGRSAFRGRGPENPPHTPRDELEGVYDPEGSCVMSKKIF